MDPSTVEVANVCGDGPAQVPFEHEDEVPQTLLAQGPHEALDVGADGSDEMTAGRARRDLNAELELQLQ